MERNFTYRLTAILITLLVIEVCFWGSVLGLWYYLEQYVEAFRFEHIQWLWLLTIVPVMITLYVLLILWKKKALSRFSDVKLLPQLIPGISTAKSVSQFVLLRLGLSLCIIALANPQYGESEKEAKTKAIDIMVAIDVSNSMLARDLSKERTRLEIAKLSIQQLLDKLHGDRLGIVVFAGGAYTQLPITDDYTAAKLFLSGINTGMVSAQGTDIGYAIEECMNSFDFDNGTKKAIIIFSDGEDHEESGITGAKTAHEEGVIIHTIGMGTEKGVPIPMYRNNKQTGVKKDKDGNTVLTKLNEPMLLDVANAGGGVYVRANKSSVGLEGLITALNKMDKTTVSVSKYQAYDDRFQPFLLVGVLLILLAQLIGERRSQFMDRLFE